MKSKKTKRISNTAYNKQKKEKKKIGKQRVIIITLVIIAAISLLILAALQFFAKIQIFNFGSIVPFSSSYTSDIKDVELNKSNIYILYGNNLSCLNLMGKQNEDYNLSYNLPQISGEGDYLIAYDASGNEYRILKKHRSVYQSKSKNDCPITYAAIASNGEYAIVTRPSNEDGYATILTYYDKNGNELFTWNCVDYITNVKISPKSNYILLTSINSDLINVKSTVYALDIEKCKDKEDSGNFSHEFDKNVYSTQFISNTTISVFTGKERFIYDFTDLEATVITQTFSDDIVRYSNDIYGYFAIVTRQNNAMLASVYDNKNNLLYSKKLKKYFNDIQVAKNKLYLLYDNKITVLLNDEKTDTYADKLINQKNLYSYGRRIYSANRNNFFKN